MEAFEGTNNIQHREGVRFDDIDHSQDVASESDLRLMDMSLKILSHSASLAGMQDIASFSKAGSMTIRWVQSVNMVKSGALQRGLQAPVHGTNKEAATFFKSAMQTIGLVTTPLKLFSSSSQAADDDEISSFYSLTREVRDEELKHLAATMKRMKPVAKYEGVMASIQRVRNLDASASEEDKRAAYTDMAKNVSGMMKVAAAAFGYKDVADILGAFSAGCGVIKLFQTTSAKTPTAHKPTFSSLQTKVQQNIQSQLQQAREQIQKRRADEEDADIQAMLKELEDELLLDERSFCGYAQSAANGEELAEVLESFSERSLQTLAMNGVEINTESTNALATSCNKYTTLLTQDYQKLQSQLDDTLHQVQNDIQKGETALANLRARATADPKNAFACNKLISQLVKVRIELLGQRIALSELKESIPQQNEGTVRAEAIEKWLKATKTYINDESISEMHALTEHLLAQA